MFSPLQIGDITLKHRAIMAPLTRYRAPNHIPNDMMVTYYKQRATEGGLIISECTCISTNGGIAHSMPRIDTEEAVEAWKPVVDAVHDKKGFVYCQLNHLGRTIVPGKYTYTAIMSSASNKLAGEGFVEPKQMDKSDMDTAIAEFVHAAENAIKSGFDGIEIHGANGYLLDQFVEDNINTRTDEFGGSIENRCKFPLMVLDAVISKLGAKKVGYRISPWDIFQEADDSDPLGHFTYFCEQLEKRGLAYVHAVEARSDANGGRENDEAKVDSLDTDLLKSSVALLKKALPTTPLISAGGWDWKNSSLEGLGVDALAYGRYFISNPDLPDRLRDGVEFTPYDRNTFYTPLTEKGYIDYKPYK